MTDMNARQVHAAAMDDPYMATADDQTNEWSPGAIVWIVAVVIFAVLVCSFFSWFFDFVGLPDNLAATWRAIP